VIGVGPLAGIRVLELAANGPVPFCGMLLADLGANVIRIDRLGAPSLPIPLEQAKDVTGRGRRSLAVDLKNPAGRDLLLRLCSGAGVLLEGNRPGVMERLGLDPPSCFKCNPKLIYGRATGWGQDGTLAATAGHDINYLAVAGVLHGIGHRNERPVPPLNLVADYGGGGMLLAVGVLAALLESQRSGRGQVIDAAMIDGASLLQTVIYGLSAMGQWRSERGSNFLDSGCFYYDVYRTGDDLFVAVGALEPRFFALLVQGLGLTEADFPDRENPALWERYRQKLQAVFLTRTRAQWCEIFAGTDACVSPVLTMAEASEHPHARARGAFVEVAGITQPAPAPRFSRTPATVGGSPPVSGQDTLAVLQELGLSAAEIEQLTRAGALQRTSTAIL
jgi:alpha-methylacyl-CoA racemase